jgi:peptide chain release factor 2
LQTEDPETWNNQEKSQRIQKEVKQLRDKKDKIDALTRKYEDIETLIEMGMEAPDEATLEELQATTRTFVKDLNAMKLETLLSGKYDANGAILTYHAGAGGTEAQDWVQMLIRMHTRWAESKGYTVKTLDYLDGEEAGIKSATLSIEGVNAYGYLKSENGVHRLVRISPFDSSGRRHTSFASLEVMPEYSDDNKIEINPDDLKVDTYRSGGAGGQHVNKTSSAVRITHIPTGVVTACQNERSQLQNKETAMKMLKSRLMELKEREHKEKVEDLKGIQMDIAWGSQIRSYVFCPYTLAKDHRTNFENGNINAVMDGELDGFINAYLSKQVE